MRHLTLSLILVAVLLAGCGKNSETKKSEEVSKAVVKTDPQAMKPAVPPLKFDVVDGAVVTDRVLDRAFWQINSVMSEGGHAITTSNNGFISHKPEGMSISLTSSHTSDSNGGRSCYGGSATAVHSLKAPLEKGTLVVDYEVVELPTEAQVSIEASIVTQVHRLTENKMYEIRRPMKVLFVAGNAAAAEKTQFRSPAVALSDKIFPKFFDRGRHRVTSTFQETVLSTQVDQSLPVKGEIEKSDGDYTPPKFFDRTPTTTSRIQLDFVLSAWSQKLGNDIDLCLKQAAHFKINRFQVSSETRFSE